MAAKQPKICPMGGSCDDRAAICQTRCRRWVGATPLEILFAHDPKPAVHFVGFPDDRRARRGDELQQWVNAERVFGPPDFVHVVWDQRAQREIADYDTVVFARYHDKPPSRFNYDDSNQAGDPAAAERLTA